MVPWCITDLHIIIFFFLKNIHLNPKKKKKGKKNGRQATFTVKLR